MTPNPIRSCPVSEAFDEWERSQLVEELYRLRRIETAAQNIAETLNGGFVVCSRCGDQESTTQLDYARELYEALGMKMAKR